MFAGEVMVNTIRHLKKYHITPLCLSSKFLYRHCFSFLLGSLQVPGENGNNVYARFWRTNKEYYGIFESVLWQMNH